jgi:hypothetical protein
MGAEAGEGGDDEGAQRQHRGQSTTEHDTGEGGGAAVEEEAARQVRWCIFFIFSCNKKEWLIIEVITLFEYVNNF